MATPPRSQQRSLDDGRDAIELGVWCPCETLPVGASALTFLFTDIEGSTKLVTQLGIEGWEDVLRDHARIVGGAIAGAGGETVHTEGDSFFAVFEAPTAAVAAAARAELE